MCQENYLFKSWLLKILPSKFSLRLKKAKRLIVGAIITESIFINFFVMKKTIYWPWLHFCNFFKEQYYSCRYRETDTLVDVCVESLNEMTKHFCKKKDIWWILFYIFSYFKIVYFFSKYILFKKSSSPSSLASYYSICLFNMCFLIMRYLHEKKNWECDENLRFKYDLNYPW